MIINELADKHNTPRFVPHVTVAGPIEDKTAEEVLKAFQELGAALPVRRPPACGSARAPRTDDGAQCAARNALQQVYRCRSAGCRAPCQLLCKKSARPGVQAEC